MNSTYRGMPVASDAMACGSREGYVSRHPGDYLEGEHPKVNLIDTKQ